MHKNCNPKGFPKEFLKEFQKEFQTEFQKEFQERFQKKIPKEFPKETINRILFTKKILYALSILNSRLEFEILFELVSILIMLTDFHLDEAKKSNKK